MTFLKLKALAEHALGGNPDSRISKGHIVNEAIRFLYDAHPWTWKRKLATLAAVQDTATIALPADFESIEKVTGVKDSTLRCVEVSPDTLLDLIRANRSASDRLYYCLIGGDAANAYQLQMRVYPVPTANAASYLNLLYAGGFTRFTEDDTATGDDAKLAPVPVAYEGCLTDLVRAKAQSEEIDPANEHWQLALQRIDTLKAKDAKVAPAAIGGIYTVQSEYMDSAGCGADVPLYPEGELVLE